MELIRRIKEIADKEGNSLTSLERKIGASKGVLSRAYKNGTDIQSKWLALIVENYPQYDSFWIITGKEKVDNFQPKNVNPNANPNVNLSNPNSVNLNANPNVNLIDNVAQENESKARGEEKSDLLLIETIAKQSEEFKEVITDLRQDKAELKAELKETKAELKECREELKSMLTTQRCLKKESSSREIQTICTLSTMASDCPLLFLYDLIQQYLN